MILRYERYRKMADKTLILPLQAIRAMAYILIFLCHMYIFPPICAGLGVSVFIVMSGFLMVYKNYDNEMETSFKGCLSFMISKIKKLYMLHILTMIVALMLIIIPALKGTVKLDSFSLIIKVLLNGMLLQAWVPHSSMYFSLNGVSWYLSLAVFLYMVFPLVLTKIQKYRGCTNAYASIVVVIILQIVGAWISQQIYFPQCMSDDFAAWFTYVFPLYRLGDYIVGCNIGYIFLNKKKETINGTKSLIEMALLGIVALSLIIASKYSDLHVYSVVFYLPIAIMVVLTFTQEEGMISRLLTNQLLVNIGNLGAYTFLIHQVVIRYCKLFLPRIIGCEINVFLIALVAFILTWIVAALYKKIEHIIIFRYENIIL